MSNTLKWTKTEQRVAPELEDVDIVRHWKHVRIAAENVKFAEVGGMSVPDRAHNVDRLRLKPTAQITNDSRDL